LWLFNKKGHQFWVPFANQLEKVEFINFQLGSIFFSVIFFLFLIDGILIYSMMLNDVEERTYEFAMLRTLGFKNSSLVTLLIVQACFQSIPATIVGFVLLYIFLQAAQLALYLYMGVTVAVQLNWAIVLLGIVTGVVVPMVSNIYPIKQALGTSLRDALDRFRQGVDEMSVQFIRMENAGTSLT
jgi:ABC-type antimicrobial peptide transport system permease subunit